MIDEQALGAASWSDKDSAFFNGSPQSGRVSLKKTTGGDVLLMPASRPLPSIGERCHELRIKDSQLKITWRIIYRTDLDAVLIADVFAKKTRKLPLEAIWRCKARLKKYDQEQRRS